MNNTYLAHYGVLGMKWGVRRYQNKDGSLTSAGKTRIKNSKREKVLERGRQSIANTYKNKVEEEERSLKSLEEDHAKYLKDPSKYYSDPGDYISEAKKDLKEAKRIYERVANTPLSEFNEKELKAIENEVEFLKKFGYGGTYIGYF